MIYTSLSLTKLEMYLSTKTFKSIFANETFQLSDNVGQHLETSAFLTLCHSFPVTWCESSCVYITDWPTTLSIRSGRAIIEQPFHDVLWRAAGGGRLRCTGDIIIEDLLEDLHYDSSTKHLMEVYLTLALVSHECHGSLILRQDELFGLTTKTTRMLRITGRLWRAHIDKRWIP